LVIVPLVPVTVSVLLPFFALLEAEAVSVPVTLPEPVIVGGCELTVTFSPVLDPPALSETAPRNPFCGAIVTV
jgi:hypothetical protein